jgi:predicted unusual protein kinase regulating ubiquinone biosynthesis (AarF/ABC1/UbiB family)
MRLSDNPRDDVSAGLAVVSSAVPSGRWARLARLGSLATTVAGGMVAEGARQLAQGKRPRLSDMLLTPANVRRVTQQLAQLRGAAMKVGQLLSMDAGDLLPPELSAILAQLRSDARAMPKQQVLAVLQASWGADWQRQFQQFHFTPVAAASIGQVHRALHVDGRTLAIKIQYPGVRESINSDVDNVAALLRVSGLLPKTLDLQPLLAQAKQQLHDEADYLLEGAYLARYGGLLADTPAFLLPALQADLTTSDVLAMSFVGGVPVEQMALASQAERDQIAGLLISLLFRELFEFQLLQTDPNFANYRYDAQTRQLILLDFGATRPCQAALVKAFHRLLTSALAGDRPAMRAAAIALGYFDANTQERHQLAVLALFDIALEPLLHDGLFDFEQSDLAQRLRDAGLVLGLDAEFWHIPTADVLFLHRKLGGLYLLAARLKACVNVHQMFKNQPPLNLV